MALFIALIFLQKHQCSQHNPFLDSFQHIERTQNVYEEFVCFEFFLRNEFLPRYIGVLFDKRITDSVYRRKKNKYDAASFEIFFGF